MSRATLYVRFPVGSLRYGLYNGTTDIVCAPLYSSAAEAWDAYDLSVAEPDEQGEEVLIATDYGDGSWFEGRATPDRAVSPLQPMG